MKSQPKLDSTPTITAKKILDKRWTYTLYQTSQDWYLAVVCGDVGLYEVIIRLTTAELNQYQEHGASYLDELAAEISYYYPKRFGERNLRMTILST